MQTNQTKNKFGRRNNKKINEKYAARTRSLQRTIARANLRCSQQKELFVIAGPSVRGG